MHINERPHGRGNDRAGVNLTWDLRNVIAGTTSKQFNRERNENDEAASNIECPRWHKEKKAPKTPQRSETLERTNKRDAAPLQDKTKTKTNTTAF
jgi:hypothetical protein